MRVYSDPVSWRAWEDEAAIELGEVFFAHEPTAAELADAFPDWQPPAPPAVTDVSTWQFMMAAWGAGFITHAEALAAVKQRVMPAVFARALADLPEPMRLAAELKFAGITRVVRDDPLFDLLIASEAATAEQLDVVFAAAAEIT